MALTEPGRALAAGVPGLLTDWDRLRRETRSAASRASRVLRVGFLASAANELTPRITAAFVARRPGWRADMRQAPWSDPTAGLYAGDVDAALLRLPFPGQADLRTETLLTEARWVVLPDDHPLASRDAIPFRELWDEPFVAAPPETGPWHDYWLAVDEREGHPVRIGAVNENPDDWLTAIANGYGIALAPESAARFYPRPGVVYRPVIGVAPTRVGVAWPTPTQSSRTSSAAAWTRGRLNRRPSVRARCPSDAAQRRRADPAPGSAPRPDARPRHVYVEVDDSRCLHAPPDA